MSKPVIEIKNLVKSFYKGTFDLEYLKKIFFSNENEKKKFILKNYFKVIDKINLTIQSQDRVAFIGKNGSGKSTLCKLISNITEPDEGEISVNGKTIPMLSLQYGLELECTCFENIHFLCSIYGLSKDNVNKKISQILNFSELHNFIDTPLKKFSSGMLIRLVFSCLVYVDGDIILADEILATSDDSFKQKCITKLLELNDSGSTLICISHEQKILKALCKEAYIFNGDGSISKKMELSEALDKYSNIETK